jgi:hypothetical protein
MRAHLPARLAALVLLLVAPLAFTACDSDPIDTEGDLTPAYFAGTWHLTAVSDGTGNRTADVEQILDDLSAAFTLGGTYTLGVDFSEVANGGGAVDATYAGNYGISTSNLVLVLPATETTPELAVSFGATRVDATHFQLAAPAAVLSGLLGATGQQLGLTGTVTLTLTKS